MDQVLVDLDERSYPIYIGENLLSKAGELLKKSVRSEKVMVITNPTVGGLYRDVLVEGLRASGFQVFSTIVPDGEEHKNLAWANTLYSVLLDHRMDRSSIILALGGGVIGDLAGFVAATFKRGLPFIQVPTTLLAQVDASVGGKVAVDHPRGKNMIGAFYQPSCVLVSLDVLHTLPARELRAGLAEVIKYGVIRDEELFGYLEEKLESLLERELDSFLFVVRRSCQIKASVVAQDERELGLRAILNFGHTLGHAIEAAADYRLFRHGEAVAMGMIYATRIAVKLQMTTEKTLLRLGGMIERVGLPTSQGNINPDKIIEFLHHDKKVLHGRVRFVLPRKIGLVEIVDIVPEKLIKEVLQEQKL
jgi:3-dehydroquinate synthase